MTVYEVFDCLIVVDIPTDDVAVVPLLAGITPGIANRSRSILCTTD